MLRAAIAPSVLALLLAGCAREAAPARTAHSGGYPSAATAYGWPPETLGGPAQQPERPLVAGLGIAAGPQPEAGRAATSPPPVRPQPSGASPKKALAAAPIAGGEACLTELERLAVAFQKLESKKGIATPIMVTGPIGGLTYKGGTGGGLVADCRLAVALHRAAPVLKELGVTGLRYSGAYSYRMSKVGRLSYHAHGLAIDVHELEVNGRWLSVKTDYAARLEHGCGAESPLLNQVACRLAELRLFKELLTPDYDAAHRDHLHLGIAPLE